MVDGAVVWPAKVVVDVGRAVTVGVSIDSVAIGEVEAGDAEGARPPSGDNNHSTTAPSAQPTNPAVTDRPRPIATGGSVARHTASPSSDGCRHARS